MNFWKVILATVVIFVAGVVTGGLLVNYSDRSWQNSRRFQPRENARKPANPNLPPGPRDAQRQPNLPVRMPPGLNMEFVQKLDSEVRLSPEQRERIEKIIADGQQRNKELWKRIAPELRQQNVQTKDRIREALTPEQRERFDELMKQRQPRHSDESLPPNARAREPHRPITPPDAPENPQSAPQTNP